MTMNQPNLNLDPAGEDPIYAARRAAAEAEAARLGIKPFDPDEWAQDADTEGQTLAERQQEVDEFLRELRAWRAAPQSPRAFD